ncbi:MAG TPA: Holliday junction branch migration protein RuvA [Flavobacteriaceae bacterium]|jgi:Holliday junction DNA helicase RuvA|nr:Holliday junction branch migration protein RuvA [Flavobacteriaceae bacterium]
MITHIRGRLVEKNPTSVVIDCNGIGYEVNISLHTFSLLSEEENVKLYTHLIIREDAHVLYGFAEPIEREVFRLLLTVSGVGASTARTMLSSLSPDEIKEAIGRGDVGVIQSVKGIGNKTAQRVIVDLKDKVISLFDYKDILDKVSNTNLEEALSALETLGFPRKQAEKVCEKIARDNPDISVETIIKLALKNL